MVATPGQTTLDDVDTRVQEVATVEDLAAVFTLEHRVFKATVPAADAVESALVRMRQERSRRFVVRDEADNALAAGGLTIMKRRWAMVWGGATHPAHRHQGLYRAVVTRRLHEAWQAGARFVATNANPETSAPELERMGFRIIEPFTILRPPETAQTSQSPWAVT